MPNTTTAKPDPSSGARGARSELTRERILDATLAMAARGRNLEQVTMRELAAQMGVGTMTLYGYFRSKDELVDATLDRAAEEIELPRREGPWKQQLRSLLGEAYRVLRKYPAGVQVRARRAILSTGALRTTDAAMAIMSDAGLDKREAARAWRVLFIYTFGFVAFTPESITDEVADEWRARLASLDAGELPALVDALPEAMEAMTDSHQFFEGLDLILDGLERRLAASNG